MMIRKYRRTIFALRDGYFAPSRDARRRLFEEIDCDPGLVTLTRRAMTVTRIGLAVAAVLAVLVGVRATRPDYLDRYQIDGFVQAVRSIDMQIVWERIRPAGIELKEESR